MKHCLTPYLLLFACLQAEAADRMNVRFSDRLEQVSVELCFDGPAAQLLYRNARADSWSDGVYYGHQKLTESDTDGTLRLPDLPDNACIHWQADLIEALRKDDRRLIIKLAKDLLMNANIWFWKGPQQRDLQVSVHLPEGISFSTPWARLDGNDMQLNFKPDNTPAGWETRIAIGRFEVQQIDIPGAGIRLAIPGETQPQQIAKFRHWIEESTLAVSQVFGHFPQAQPQVLIVKVGKSRKSTLFGQVTRGGGLATILLVDENRPLDEFTADWTATHEFSHMLLPYISSRDRWLSEGLASYYQNVLRARNGRLTEQQAWQKLYEGFARGKDGTNGGSLAQATRSGRNSTMRVYWSGAAMMLKADMRLREVSNGTQSLDTALLSLSECCMENGKTWRARELFSRLDSLTGSAVFSTLFQQHVYAENFPDMGPTWQQLGVQTGRKKVTLSDDAPLAAIRRSIMQG